MKNDDWGQVTSETTRFPGPSAFFVSGYAPLQLTTLRALLDELGHKEAPIRPCVMAHLDAPLEDALSSESDDAPLGEGKLPYTLVISGMTADDVRGIMQHFSTCGLPRPIFATTTENNLKFTVKELLRHLLAEQQAMRGANGPKP